MFYFSVVDDSDHDRITAGSLVTLSVTLSRTELLDHCGTSIDELMAEEDPTDPIKETPPPQDGEDEVCMCQCTIQYVMYSVVDF